MLPPPKRRLGILHSSRICGQHDHQINATALLDCKNIADVLDLEFYFGPPRTSGQPVMQGFAEAAVKKYPTFG
jgi:hypothetical protein